VALERGSIPRAFLLCAEGADLATICRDWSSAGFRVTSERFGPRSSYQSITDLALADQSAELVSARVSKPGTPMDFLVQYGLSGIPCASVEHSLELAGSFGADSDTLPAVAACMLADTMRSQPQWVIGTILGRGPSMPELRSRVLPAIVDLRQVCVASHLQLQLETRPIEGCGYGLVLASRAEALPIIRKWAWSVHRGT